MLNAFTYLLCSFLCRHNPRTPTSLWAPEAARTTASVFTVMAHTHTLNSLMKFLQPKHMWSPSQNQKRELEKCAVLYCTFNGSVHLEQSHPSLHGPRFMINAFQSSTSRHFCSLLRCLTLLCSGRLHLMQVLSHQIYGVTGKPFYQLLGFVFILLYKKKFILSMC